MAETGGRAGLAMRKLAAETLAAVQAGQAFQPFDAARLPDGRDRAFANRLVTVALRRNAQLDLIVAALLQKGVPKRSGFFEPILRIGLAELLFVPGAAAHAALASAVALVKADRRGGHLSGLLNAVLREAQRRAGELIALPPETLIPEPFLSAWRAQYGAAALARFAAALIETPPLDLSFAADDAALVAALGARPTLPLSARIDHKDRAVGALDGYAAGKWWVQDVAASLPVRLIDLPPGARVLDLCAAPGGKTAQLCAKGYRVTALDNDADRLVRLRDNLARLGFSAQIVCADAADPPDLGRFDAVLVDAPCSATGTFRRHPEVLVNRSAADIAGRVALQRRILARAVPLVAPGGTLIYATCSLEAAEGEDQAGWLTTGFPGLRPVDTGRLPVLAPAVTRDGYVRTHPGLDWPELGAGFLDGFFIARFTQGI